MNNNSANPLSGKPKSHKDFIEPFGFDKLPLWRQNQILKNFKNANRTVDDLLCHVVRRGMAGLEWSAVAVMEKDTGRNFREELAAMNEQCRIYIENIFDFDHSDKEKSPPEFFDFVAGMSQEMFDADMNDVKFFKTTSKKLSGGRLAAAEKALQKTQEELDITAATRDQLRTQIALRSRDEAQAVLNDLKKDQAIINQMSQWPIIRKEAYFPKTLKL